MRIPRVSPIVLALLVPVMLPVGAGETTVIDIWGPEILEAENFSSQGLFCDGQARIVEDSAASGGAYVRVRSWCVLEFDVITTSSWGKANSVVVRGPVTSEVIDVSLSVDEVYIDGVFRHDVPEIDGSAKVSFGDSRAISPGEHRVKIGIFPRGGEILLDAILFDLHGDDGCTNAPPVIENVSANGIGPDGLAGWVGYDYTLDVETTDPDGDVAEVDPDYFTRPWRAGPLALFIRVTDEPEARCPGVPAFTIERRASFLGLADLAVSFEDLAKGRSCFAGSIADTPGAQLVVESCLVGVSIAGAAGPIPLQTEYLLDFEPFAIVNGTSPTATFVVDDFGASVLGACTRSPGDIHAREFCATEYGFTGVPVG